MAQNIDLSDIRFIVQAGLPTGITAPKGSIYVNTTAAGANLRMYINSDGGTTWGAVTSA